jgi:hypothetical protein
MVPSHADNQPLLQLNWLDMTVPRLCMLPASRWVAAPCADRNGCRRRGRSPLSGRSVVVSPRRMARDPEGDRRRDWRGDAGVHRAFMVPSPSVLHRRSQWAQVQLCASVPEDRWGSQLRHAHSPRRGGAPLTRVGGRLPDEEPDPCSRAGRGPAEVSHGPAGPVRRAAGVLFPGRHPRLRAQTRAGSAGENS